VLYLKIKGKFKKSIAQNVNSDNFHTQSFFISVVYKTKVSLWVTYSALDLCGDCQSPIMGVLAIFGFVSRSNGCLYLGYLGVNAVVFYTLGRVAKISKFRFDAHSSHMDSLLQVANHTELLYLANQRPSFLVQDGTPRRIISFRLCVFLSCPQTQARVDASL
jgi:hypothetical protein